MLALTKCLKCLLIFPLLSQNAQPARSSPYFVAELWPPQTGGHPSPPQVGSQLESFLPGHHRENRGRHRRPTHDTKLLQCRVVGSHGTIQKYGSPPYKRPWQDTKLQHYATQEMRARYKSTARYDIRDDGRAGHHKSQRLRQCRLQVPLVPTYIMHCCSGFSLSCTSGITLDDIDVCHKFSLMQYANMHVHETYYF